MLIKKKYHFYAAHRNELLEDKCYNLHGHVYRFQVYVESEITEKGCSILFNDIDTYVDPVISAFDHGCFVHVKDKKLMEALKILGTKKYVLDNPTSTEVIAQAIFNIIKNLGLPIVRVDLQETESSTVIYQP